MKYWIIPSSRLGKNWLEPVQIERERQELVKRVASLEAYQKQLPTRIANAKKRIEEIETRQKQWECADGN